MYRVLIGCKIISSLADELCHFQSWLLMAKTLNEKDNQLPDWKSEDSYGDLKDLNQDVFNDMSFCRRTSFIWEIEEYLKASHMDMSHNNCKALMTGRIQFSLMSFRSSMYISSPLHVWVGSWFYSFPVQVAAAGSSVIYLSKVEHYSKIWCKPVERWSTYRKLMVMHHWKVVNIISSI